VIAPLRTAATTAALRRTTHLFVFGTGRLSMSGGVPARDSLESVSSRGVGDPDDPTPRDRGPLVTDLVGNIAAYPLVFASTCPIPSRSAIRDHFTKLSRFPTCLSSIFFTPLGSKKGLCHSGH
jgi:hypothetical protein